MTIEDNTAATASNTDAINRETAARGRVEAALEGLGSVVGSIIRGAPQQLAPILAATPGLKKFSQSMAFAEGYVDVWRDLTTRGVSFGNELDTMITSVGAANLQIQQFQKLIENNAATFVSLGGTMNAGATEFLRLQQNFEKLDGPFSATREHLNQLGMNSEIIATRFAESDTLDAIRNVRTRRTEAQRNRSATEYALTLDTLSRLTGKQADALAAEQAQVSRQGNVFAFSQTLRENVQDELDAGLTELGQYGDAVKNYATDMLTRAFPDPNDPAVLAIHSASPELRDALLNARNALMAGNETLSKEYMAQASQVAADLRNNQQLQRLASLGAATDITRASMDVITQLNNSTLVMSQQAIREQARALFGEADSYTDEQMARARAKLVADDIAAQRALGSNGEALLNSQLEAVRQVQAAAQTLQQTAVTELTALANTSINSLVDTFGDPVNGFAVKLGEELDRQLVNVRGLFNGMDASFGPQGQMTRTIDEQIRVLTAVGDSINASDPGSAQVGRINTMITEIQQARDAYMADDSQANRDRLDQLMANASATITANRDIFVNGEKVTLMGDIGEVFQDVVNSVRSALGLEPIEYQTGTMGQEGSLFKNFGSETIAALHGIEAVVTPDQMHAIVRNSALGAIDAMAVLGEGARFNAGALDGMLNTIRTLPTQMAQMQPSNTDNTALQNTMSRLGTELRNSLETALNNTLVPSVDQLVAINSQHAETSDKIRRGIGNMGNDMLRSA